jgi:hypothetical protein
MKYASIIYISGENQRVLLLLLLLLLPPFYCLATEKIEKTKKLLYGNLA